jgi:hypothetical protein
MDAEEDGDGGLNLGSFFMSMCKKRESQHPTPARFEMHNVR